MDFAYLNHIAALKYIQNLGNQRTTNDFSMILLFHSSILVSTDQHWSVLASIVQYWFTLIHLDQHSPTSTTNNTDRYWSPMINISHNWSTLINTGQHWWTLINTVNIDQHWSTLSNIDQHWSTLIIIDEHWLNMPSYSIPSHPLPYACIKGPAIPTQASESCRTSRPSCPLGIRPSIRSSTLPQSQVLKSSLTL